MRVGNAELAELMYQAVLGGSLISLHGIDGGMVGLLGGVTNLKEGFWWKENYANIRDFKRTDGCSLFIDGTY